LNIDLGSIQRKSDREDEVLYSTPLNFRWRTAYSPVEMMGYTQFPVKRSVNGYFTKKSEEPAQPYITSHDHSTTCERSLQLDTHPSISTGEDAGKSGLGDGEERLTFSRKKSLE